MHIHTIGSHQSSLLNITEWVSESVSQWVSDKGKQWSDLGLIKIKMIVTMFRKVLINEEQKCKRSKCRKSLVVAGVKEDENFHWCAGLWKDSIYMENSKAFPAMGNLLSCFNQWKNSQSAFSLQKILSCLRNLIKFKLILLEKFLGSKSRLGVVYQTAGYFFAFWWREAR